ncbi:MAG: ribonuclease PH [Acidimicrobiales bacterium]
MRPDGRAPDELRPIRFERDYTDMTPGSVLVSFGRTRVLCTVSVEEDIPRWLKGRGSGWVTAEYAMLPGSSNERVRRSLTNGRSQEIQRLIGRSLRAVTDLVAMGETSITVDCDVLQADGGTRTASICGSYLALHDACTRLVASGRLRRHPMLDDLAAVSVGIMDGVALLDLPYAEDSQAEVDFNVVMTGDGRFVEVQGTAEGNPFTPDQLTELVSLAAGGIAQIVTLQRAYLATPPAVVD